MVHIQVSHAKMDPQGCSAVTPAVTIFSSDLNNCYLDKEEKIVRMNWSM